MEVFPGKPDSFCVTQMPDGDSGLPTDLSGLPVFCNSGVPPHSLPGLLFQPVFTGASFKTAQVRPTCNDRSGLQEVTLYLQTRPMQAASGCLTELPSRRIRGRSLSSYSISILQEGGVERADATLLACRQNLLSICDFLEASFTWLGIDRQRETHSTSFPPKFSLRPPSFSW